MDGLEGEIPKISSKGEKNMSKEKSVKEIDVESLDAELAAAR